MARISTKEELRRIIAEPRPATRVKILDALDEQSTEFLKRCPFALVGTTSEDGTVEVGPNAVLAAGRHHYRGSRPDLRELLETVAGRDFLRLARTYWRTGAAEMVRSRSRHLYARAARALIPAVAASDLRPAGAGVRAQALGTDGALIDDFSILRSPGQVHVLNAPSPAATASFAVGRHIAGLLDD